MTITDQIGRELIVKATPKRIVCLVPSLTELLFDLGLEDSIVGLTKFCIYPFHAKQTKTVVGGTKKVRFDKIKSLEPDIILCNKEENSEEIVALCSKIANTHVSDIYSIADTLALIEQYGALFNRRIEAKSIRDKINYQYQKFTQYIHDKPSIKVAYFIWRDPWMAAASKTFIHHLLTLCKFENIYADRERYPEVALKKMRLEGDPAVVFLSSEPYPFKEEHAFEVGRHAHHSKVVFVDGAFFSWYGSRLIKAFDYFKQLRERIGMIAF